MFNKVHYAIDDIERLTRELERAGLNPDKILDVMIKAMDLRQDILLELDDESLEYDIVDTAFNKLYKVCERALNKALYE